MLFSVVHWTEYHFDEEDITGRGRQDHQLRKDIPEKRVTFSKRRRNCKRKAKTGKNLEDSIIIPKRRFPKENSRCWLSLSFSDTILFRRRIFTACLHHCCTKGKRKCWEQLFTRIARTRDGMVASFFCEVPVLSSIEDAGLSWMNSLRMLHRHKTFAAEVSDCISVNDSWLIPPSHLLELFLCRQSFHKKGRRPDKENDDIRLWKKRQWMNDSLTTRVSDLMLVNALPSLYFMSDKKKTNIKSDTVNQSSDWRHEMFPCLSIDRVLQQYLQDLVSLFWGKYCRVSHLLAVVFVGYKRRSCVKSGRSDKLRAKQVGDRV